jgi:hypothetical protein
MRLSRFPTNTKVAKEWPIATPEMSELDEGMWEVVAETRLIIANSSIVNLPCLKDGRAEMEMPNEATC